MCADNERLEPLSGFTRWLAGSERPRPVSHKHLGPLHADEAVAFTLVLRRKPGSPPLPKIESNEEIHVHLSLAEYVERYGADSEELEAAAAFLRGQGMTVLEAHAGRRTLSVLGTAAQADAVFGVKLQRYIDVRATELLQSRPSGDKPTGKEVAFTHRGFDGAVYLPAELSEAVIAVVGFDDRYLGSSQRTGSADPGVDAHPPVSAALEKLKLPNTGAYGETIAILAAQAPGFSGAPPCYLSSDINQLYFANLPAGYRTRPSSITDVNLTVGTTTYRNNPLEVARIASLENASDAILELTQEISTAAAVAQGARINVYFSEASEQGYLYFLNRILVPGWEKQPTVVSLSLGIYDGSTAQTGEGASGSTAHLIEELFQQIAAMGISIFLAVGDWQAGRWQLLAAPNLVPPRAGLPLSSGAARPTAKALLSAAALEGTTIADETSGPHGGHVIPDFGSEAAYSGFFVNGVSFSYAGASCAAAFNAGLAAMLRSAYGSGLEFLSSMLADLKRNAAGQNPQNGQEPQGLQVEAQASEEEESTGTGSRFFAIDLGIARAVSRHRFRTWRSRPRWASMMIPRGTA